MEVFNSVHSVLSDSATPWTAVLQASQSITNSWSLLKLMSIESVIPSNHLISCHTLILLSSIFPSIRVFSNESFPSIRWPKGWSFSFIISPSNEYSGLISFRMDWLGSLQLNFRNSLKLKFCVTIFSCLFKNHWLKTYVQHIYADTQTPKLMWYAGANLYSYLNRRCLFFGRKAMTNLDNILKSRDITLPTKVHLVKAMGFPVVMYGYVSWTIKKAECRRIDTFELCCWRRLLRVPWTARRSIQSILKEISLEYSLEGLMLRLKLQ